MEQRTTRSKPSYGGQSSTSLSATSFMLTHQRHFSGLPSLKLPRDSKFNAFPTDPTYKFPTLNKSVSTEDPSRLLFTLSDFTVLDSVDLRKSLETLHLQSPFKAQLVTDPPHKDESRLSLSFFSDEVIFNPDDEQLSEFDWGENRIERSSLASFEEACISRPVSNVHTAVAELIPELSDESQFSHPDLLKHQDEEVPQETEVSIQKASRIFLRNRTASKLIMNSCPVFPCRPSVMTSTVEVPDNYSPIYRKLVFCQRSSAEIRIVTVATATGFLTVPDLAFSAHPTKTQVVVHSSPTYTLLLNAQIVRALPSLVWLSCGFDFCVGLELNGSAYSWGYGGSGCLGHGDCSSVEHPRRIVSSEEFVYIECGAYHTAAVTRSQQLWTWGRSDVGQLALPESLLTQDAVGLVAYRPLLVKDVSNVVAAACGEAHTLALTEQGKVFSFGWNEHGQLGHQNRQNCLDRTEKFAKIAAGSLFSVGLTVKGQVLVWGNGEQGQLGLGKQTLQSEEPMLVTSLEEEIVDILCGEARVLCIGKSGNAYGWGQGLARDFPEFEPNSAIVCFLPRQIHCFDNAHRLIIN